MPEPDILEPERIEVTCPFCESNEVFIIDFIAGAMFPLPDIFAIECKKCGHTGSGYQDSRGWKTEWSNGVEAAT
jgi:hypothetical protein